VALSWTQFWPYALTALIIGVLAEAVARGLRLWVYRSPWLVLVNLIAMYGLVMGGIATLVPRRGAIAAFVLGALAGLAYELLNLRRLQWWSFPNQRLLFLRGHVAILAVLTVLWGLVPPVTWAMRSAWPVDRPRRTLQERLDGLTAREQHLLGKLRMMHEREDQIERQIEAVRAQKRPLEDKLKVRAPGAATER